MNQYFSVAIGDIIGLFIGIGILRFAYKKSEDNMKSNDEIIEGLKKLTDKLEMPKPKDYSHLILGVIKEAEWIKEQEARKV